MIGGGRICSLILLRKEGGREGGREEQDSFRLVQD